MKKGRKHIRCNHEFVNITEARDIYKRELCLFCGIVRITDDCGTLIWDYSRYCSGVKNRKKIAVLD